MSEPQIPEGVDPVTGEVLTDDDPDQDEGAEEEALDDPAAPVEPEPDDGEGGHEPATEAPPATPSTGEGEATIERNSKALNRAAEAYIKKVVATLGPELEGMQTCPLCAETWPGIRFPVMPGPEHLAAVRVAIGLEPGDNLPKDNYSRPCSSCDGWGRVDTGSKVPAQASATCYDCGGKGWVAVGDERATGSITAANGSPEPAFAPVAFGDAAEPPEAAALRDLGFMVVKVPKIEPATPL